MVGPNPKTTGTTKSPRHQEIPDSPFTANIRRVPSRVRTLYVKFWMLLTQEIRDVVDSLDSDRFRPRDGPGHPRRGDPEVPRGLRQGEAQLAYEVDLLRNHRPSPAAAMGSVREQLYLMRQALIIRSVRNFQPALTLIPGGTAPPPPRWTCSGLTTL